MDLGKKTDDATPVQVRVQSTVEPLTHQRWARVERDLFERVANGEADPKDTTERPYAAPHWRVAVALVLAGAAAAVGGGAAWHTLRPPPRIEALGPSRVTTEAAGSRLNVGEATLDVAPRTTLLVTGDDARGVTVLLERGRVECEVPPRKGRPPFSVEAGEVTVRVVGTHFAVARSAADVDVDVQRGVVEVTSNGEHRDVRAGESWPSNPGALPASPTASAAPPSAPTPSASVPVPTPRELYEAASRLEASRPDLAVARYRDLAAKGGPWGMNALFAEGRLEADRGHITDARRLLGDYVTRYPSGPNADDARELLERLR
jgi:hypothetical protein